MTDGHHSHFTSAVATLLGLGASQVAAQVAPNVAAWKTIGIGVATTILGWLATRALSALERWWKGRKP